MGLRKIAITMGVGLGLLSGTTLAQTETAPPAASTGEGGTRLVFLAADAAEGRPGAMADTLEVLSLEGLPAEGDAEIEVLGALLRSSPVSTFVASSDASGGAQTGELHIVVDLALAASGSDGPAVTVGGETMPLGTFARRLESLVAAFNPTARQIAYIRIDDPEDRFAEALLDMRAAIEPVGFGLTVLMVGADKASCEGDRAPVHYSLIGGIADSDPFGNADGVTTAGEATAWVSDALERAVNRGEPCAARYSLILRGDKDPERVLVGGTGATPVFPEMETAVYRERFQALFLMSAEEEDPIRDYLQSCTYCPSEASLSARLRQIGEQQMALRLEAGIWEEIRNDTDASRITVYLENCQLCAYQDEAEAMIERFSAIDAARDEEAAQLRMLAAAQDLQGLRAWIDECVACEQVEEARALVTELESDGRIEQETEALQTAVASRNAEKIRGWLDNCEVCAAEMEAKAALDQLTAEAETAQSCLVAAGLPQQGGPRLLEDIREGAARAVCGTALEASPGNPLAVTAMGRIEQAAGDLEAARAAYDAGMEAGIPAAFGLAAHSLYAPGDDTPADYLAAEELALEGHARGDWLSGEVLTVLYSRDLIEGKGAADAFEIAQQYAEAGNPVAQFFTGYFYRIGNGVERSDTDAVEWLQKSVDQGYVHANSFLAEVYERGGSGVAQDGERAATLYWAALQEGDPTAIERLSNQINARSGVVIAAIQTRLRDAGVYGGGIDGIGGNATATAVRRYAQTLTQQ